MLFFISWIGFSILAGVLGSERTVGGLATFFISLILSPLIGFIVVFASDKKSDVEFRNKMLEQMKRDEEKKDSKFDLDKYKKF